MKSLVVLVVASLIATGSLAAEPLNDGQLDSVTAGSAATDADDLLKFSAQHQTASGHTVQVDGSVDVPRIQAINAASLSLKDSAQSNLKSLVNINAVQSSVNVLLNLNIMIDSHIGDLKQLNLTSK